ncbi:unnamed protein product [Allacma fusca]|uniref:Phospholipid scramblase n=1 Tax=Allacma fusca TaxID=39272 RepID=A0A8J2P4K5_9HEXA|nr:unnamed protein product [Allacma fusca]
MKPAGPARGGPDQLNVKLNVDDSQHSQKDRKESAPKLTKSRRFSRVDEHGHHHGTMYEVTNVPAIHGHTVPIKEKIKALRILKYEDFVLVRQYFDDIEEIAGTNLSNVYMVGFPNRFSFDPEEENQVFFVGEKISCEASWIKTSSRSIVFRVITVEGDTVAYISRNCTPCFCFSNICSCCTYQNLRVTLPDGRHFGTVRKCFHFITPKYAVFNADQKKIFDVSGPTSGNFCPCWLISNIIWKIHACEGENDSAAFIQKTRTPICMETKYNLNFEKTMDVKHKMLLIALVILIDFQHFKRCSTLCQIFTWMLWVILIVCCIAVAFIFIVVCGSKGLMCKELTGR